jgi:hypothetical protein
MPNNATRDKLVEFISSLVHEGSGLQYGRAEDPLDPMLYSKFHSGICTLFHFLGEHAAPWRHKFDTTSVPVVTTRAESHISEYVGLLLAIQNAVYAGMLGKVEELIFAEAFDDLLEQAEYLLSENFFLAAGVLGRAVLEEHLRKWCVNANCFPQRARPSINDYNATLYDKTHVTKIEMKLIEALAAIGNDAAHNAPTLTQADVERLLRELRLFLV